MRTLRIGSGAGYSGDRIEPAVELAVHGNDVLAAVRTPQYQLDIGGTVDELGNRIVSANAYLGGASIAQALALRADVVITGRAADPSLFLGPLLHEFGWALDDWPLLGKGILA